VGAVLCLAGSALATFGPRGIRDLTATLLGAFRRRRTPAAGPTVEDIDEE
jgi:hypothetical protein